MQLSVIIPVYNTGEKLRNTIQSVIRQEGLTWELLLIDDGSTDGVTAAICDEYAKQYEMIRVVHQSNKGLCAARNIGVSLAKGEYVTFCDHDDEFCYDSLQGVFSFAKINGLDFVKYEYEFICLDQKPRFPFKNDVFFSGSHIMNFIEFIEKYPKFLECGKLVFVWDGIYRKSFLQNNRISFNERFRQGQEDIDFCVQLCNSVERIGYYNAVCYTHYRYRQSTSRGLPVNKTRQVISDFMFVFQKQIALFEKLSCYGLPATYLQTIELHNLLSLLAIVVKKDFSVSFREKAMCFIEFRRYLSGYQRSIENTKSWSLKEKICYLLFLKSPYMLIFISSLYARWLSCRFSKAQ